MSRRHSKKTALKTAGTSPGSLIYVGNEKKFETEIDLIEYNADSYRVEPILDLNACRLPNGQPVTTWLSVDGIHEPDVIGGIGQRYGIHPLALEDILNTLQKPKIEYFDDKYLFITLKMLHYGKTTQEVDPEHLSFILGKNFVISFQEKRQHDVFKPVLTRIEASAGKTRRNGPDYLLYALMDLVVDHYFVVMEEFGDRIEVLENSIIQQVAGQQTLTRLYGLKRELANMRRQVWPVREIVNSLLLEDSPLVNQTTMPYLRDLHDHIIQVVETIDSYREQTTSLLDVYLSTLSNRMNSVMKTLTIISSIFIPLTFIAGVYGMNFEYMPELKSPYGYWATLGVMLLIAVGSVIYFRRRGWM
ncbi:magnesium/cobalt transporter CorA [Tellurirhabdus rosea]|uniref:magnesium/cobalt transporter CorA n=1 Tax=Tellurirhabdus rosea TaxID=2674997 RepID=UPI002252202C|nr:magnesium/cobalt transporter CorA [Tellurirhabdus rosea]